jgi:hypothetical protein
VAQSSDIGKACTQVTIVGGLHGRIVRGSDNTGIHGATVSANGATVTTDNDGYFALGVADADATLSIIATGYESADYYDAASTTTTITELGDIPLASVSTSGGEITGLVTNLTSSNIEDAVVKVRHGAHNSHDVNNIVVTPTLNSDGRYDFTLASPGTYTMTVTLAGYTASTTFTVNDNNSVTPATFSIGPSEAMSITSARATKHH